MYIKHHAKRQKINDRKKISSIIGELKLIKRMMINKKMKVLVRLE